MLYNKANSHKVIVYRIAKKFGGLTDQPASHQIKILHSYILRMQMQLYIVKKLVGVVFYKLGVPVSLAQITSTTY